MIWAGYVARIGDGRSVLRVLVGKPGRKRPLGGTRCRWEVQEVGCGVMDWVGLAQDRDRWWELVKAVMNLRVL